MDFDLLVADCSNLGIEYVAYGCLSGHVSADHHTPAVLLNYPAEWVDEYFSQGLADNDPVVRNTLSAGRPLCWHELATCKDERNVLQAAAAHGLRHGFAMPILGPGGARFCLSFGASSALDSKQTYQAIGLGAMFHAKALASFDGELFAHPLQEITRKQQRILHHLAQGASGDEIADALGITRDGVNFHLRKIYSKLSKGNAAAAIAAATRLGIA
ncbi:autoinducer binding domain-containing protein [Polycladidibacter hongkongensis]|uniref:autoinducer binding domain-containing protein n=1 Tax=Polycladidibacter hongkongensis TaxID=1647556 RepID=UPI000A5CC5F7|nr:autoinducer binding domain-containing protein [Pseudovibrio hongkongensis]